MPVPQPPVCHGSSARLEPARRRDHAPPATTKVALPAEVA
jgi:hypothetical protein